MKLLAITAIAAVAIALPTDFTPQGKPRDSLINKADMSGGWESVDYSHVDYSKIDWNKIDYSKIDWTKIDYDKVSLQSPFHFTSYFEVNATPDQVVNGTTPTGGLAGASGLYKLGLNAEEDTICYNITLFAFQGDYSSPALTATHIHQASRGQSGPPRIAFPNPVDIGGGVRRSIGCMTGPFRTGVLANGQDSGEGFTIGAIEANPSSFFADVHSSKAVPGAVRGQLA